MEASFKIAKRLFCLNYILQKYHRSVSNVAMVLVAAVALGLSTYAVGVTISFSATQPETVTK